jgi:DNA repair exonuclease SbcCD ATPase subunit
MSEQSDTPRMSIKFSGELGMSLLNRIAQLERERDEARAIANDRDAMVDHRDRALTAMYQRVDVITRERDEALALNAKWAEKAETWTVSPEAAQRLRRYRDLAQQVAEVQNKRDEALVSVDTLRAAIKTAEAALADIGDSDHEPSDDLAWCELRAQRALPVVRFALAATKAKP